LVDLLAAAIATSAWSATTTSRSTPGAAPRSATSSASSATFPAAPSAWSRTIAPRPPFSPPPGGGGRNVGRKGKTLWTDNPAGRKISLEALPDDLEEARFVAAEIEPLRRGGRHLRDIAVFYRTNAQSRSSRRRWCGNLPYVMVGGIKFFSRMEIKDVLAYLRVLVNPADSLSARRIINVPPRGIGATTVERIAALEEEAGGFCRPARLALERGAAERGGGRQGGSLRRTDGILPQACCACPTRS
jgi:hypothetical protein